MIADRLEPFATTPVGTPAQNRALAVDKLRQRAEELACPPESKPQAGDPVDVCVFRLGSQICAFEARYVSNVFVLRGYTAIPCVPPFVLGVVNMRGTFLTVLDLARFFRQSGRGLNDFSKIIVITAQGREFGVVTDELLGVIRLDKSSLQTDIDTLSEKYAEYTLGISRDGVLLLDAPALLESGDLRVHSGL